MNFFVLRVASNKEDRVREALARKVKIEGLETFNATQGDVVYVPKQLWHRAHHGGTGFSTRLAMNGYPDMLHNYQPTEDMR